MNNLGAQNLEKREGISRDFYTQEWLGTAEMAHERGAETTRVETARELGETAIFSPVETEDFQEMMTPIQAENQATKMGEVETVEKRERNLALGQAGFSSYTKEFSKADGKIVAAEVKNLENNPFSGYEALQRDRAEYLKSKFNRDIE